MNKIYITTAVLIFVLSTVIVLSSGNSSQKKVQFTNQNFIINHENTKVKNEEVEVGLNKSKFGSTDVSLQNTTTSNTNTEINYEPFENQNTSYESNSTNLNTQENELNQKLADYERQKTALENLKRNNTLQENKVQSENKNRYLYKNIDWNTWKSNFINKITDDSMYIRSLDNYGIGTWFYYSFIVTYEGEIKDITVKSMYLSEQDKQKIAQMIKGYEHQEITVFPSNTNKKVKKVDAIMVLGTTEKKATPADFNENEQIKILIP